MPTISAMPRTAVLNSSTVKPVKENAEALMAARPARPPKSNGRGHPAGPRNWSTRVVAIQKRTAIVITKKTA